MEGFRFSEMYKGYYILVDTQGGYYFYKIFDAAQKEVSAKFKITQSRTAFRMARQLIDDDIILSSK